jgi:hypothetical protein
MEGSRHDSRGQGEPSYMPTADPGRHGGGTYTGQTTEPTLQDYENVFGPSARDIKSDLQKYKRHGRWHLPDALKGPNQWLTDRVDGLITDATNSPFTTKILPYKYIANPDAKLKWNVWSFDEGMSSRVPYESAARTLTQTKRSFAGYTVRQGLAIVLEHNFMMSEKGRENFKNQLQQLVGSIQYTNDLDVHVALVLAPSYQQTMREKYYIEDKSPTQICREFVDLFGFIQKNQNALDILIEEAKAQLKSWGGPTPDFMLCNSKLTFQLTMTPEKTNYLTQGIDGVKRLRTGPDISSYRGLSIIHSRSFSMDPGTPPRDILRRRVKVAEYYRIPPHSDNWKREFHFYNEERDTWFTYSFKDLLEMASYDPAVNVPPRPGNPFPADVNHTNVDAAIRRMQHLNGEGQFAPGMQPNQPNQHHLAEGARMDAMPHPLGQEFLGMHVDDLHDYSEREMVSKVLVSAMDSSWANWAPAGDFIAEDMIFAIGAMSWNQYYVSCDRNCNQNAAMNAAIAASAAAAAGGGPGVLTPDQISFLQSAIRDNGDVRFIPPEKYYFPSMDSDLARGLPVADADSEMNSRGNPYGGTRCMAFREAFKNCDNNLVHEIAEFALKPYDFTRINTVANFIAAGNIVDAYQEQCKISSAILFDSVCEYPRVIDNFYSNPNAYDPLHAHGYTSPFRNAVFRFNSHNDPEYVESVRFRNWMRYGVAHGLINTRFVRGAAAAAVNPFTSPLECINSGRNTFELADAAGNPLRTSYMPWNKIFPMCNVDAGEREQNRRHRPVSYSLFDITRGARTNRNDVNIPGLCNNLCRWRSTSVFSDSLDDGMAFLREPGAFLSPNHFHPSNDNYEYKSVGSFMGAQIILTREMLAALLRHNRRNAAPAGAAAVQRRNGTPFLENTLLLFLLMNNNEIPAQYLNKLFGFIRQAHANLLVPPAAAPAPAPAAAGGGGGAAPAPAPPPPVPAPRNFNRINVTNEFIGPAAGLTEDNDLAVCLAALGTALGYSADHTRINCVWTWPHVTNSIDDIWCQDANDYRLMEPNAGGIGAGAAAPLANIPVCFPHFAVGNQGIQHWHVHAEGLAQVAPCTAPAGHTVAAGPPPAIALLPPNAHGPAALNYHRTWAFGKQIPTRPQQDTLGPIRNEVKAFLFQLYSRLMYDQSEPPLIHSTTPQFHNIVEIARDPFRRPKVNAPFYNGMPGGMFSGRIGNIGPKPGAQRYGGPGDPPAGGPEGGDGRNRHIGNTTGNIEVVIVRPNIEHYMLGVIMGQGGDGLGNTLWGQTELSCYDDSMHGIWGMSYKYHERAIVFNEKNLVRLWDVAYDGYCGGKDATFVNWKQDRGREFKLATQDMSKNYRGPSMMVMAFVHDQNSQEYSSFKRNWPSPIVFHDKYNYNQGVAYDQTQPPYNGDYTLTADPGNIHVVNYKDMRVFNNPLYAAYQHYREMMPDFTALHAIRKPAGASTVENETFCDSLAFQGTMRITELGREVEHIQGSGHHGPDWVGVASVRSGKGYKAAGAPSLQRMV